MPILPKSYVNFAQKSALFYRSVNFIFGKKIVPQDILTPVRPSFFCLFLYYFPLFTNSAFICHAASASLFFPYPHLSFCAQVRRSRRKILPSFTPKGKPLPCKKTRPSPPIAKKSRALPFGQNVQPHSAGPLLFHLSLPTQLPPFTSGDVRRHSVFPRSVHRYPFAPSNTRLFPRHSSPAKEQPCRRLQIAYCKPPPKLPLSDSRRTNSKKAISEASERLPLCRKVFRSKQHMPLSAKVALGVF